MVVLNPSGAEYILGNIGIYLQFLSFNFSKLRCYRYLKSFLMEEDTDLLNCFNTIRLRQNGCHFRDDIFTCLFLMKMYKFQFRFHWSLSSMNNIPALVQIMSWCADFNELRKYEDMFVLFYHFSSLRWHRWLEPKLMKLLHLQTQWRLMLGPAYAQD